MIHTASYDAQGPQNQKSVLEEGTAEGLRGGLDSRQLNLGYMLTGWDFSSFITKSALTCRELDARPAFWTGRQSSSAIIIANFPAMRNLLRHDGDLKFPRWCSKRQPRSSAWTYRWGPWPWCRRDFGRNDPLRPGRLPIEMGTQGSEQWARVSVRDHEIDVQEECVEKLGQPFFR